MSLPKINSTPKYTITIPSTQKQVRFRPFLVKEEKVLMLAFESKDKTQILNSIADTVLACIEDKIDRNTLTTFDVEYLFVKIRAKSVGETVEVGVKCTECSLQNKVTINVDDINITIPKISDTIKLNEDTKLKMRWPRYFDVIKLNMGDTDSQLTTTDSFSIIAQCMDSVVTSDDIFKMSNESPEEVQSFIEQLSSSQFSDVQNYVKAMPQLSHLVNYECSCGCKNTITLRGIQDFF